MVSKRDCAAMSARRRRISGAIGAPQVARDGIAPITSIARAANASRRPSRVDCLAAAQAWNDEARSRRASWVPAGTGEFGCGGKI